MFIVAPTSTAVVFCISVSSFRENIENNNKTKNRNKKKPVITDIAGIIAINAKIEIPPCEPAATIIARAATKRNRCTNPL